MKPISTAAELKQAIAELERKKTAHEFTIKTQAREAKEALNPVHLVKNAYSRLAETPEIRKTLFSTIIGFGLGYASKKAAEFLSEESLNRMAGNLVDHGLDKIIERNPESLLSRGIDFTRNAIRERGMPF